MAIVVSCTACQKKMKVRDEHAGKRVKCPGCGTMMVVPQALVASPAVPTAPPVAAPEPDEDNNAAEATPRRKKRRRRSDEKRERRPSQPLFSMGGVDFTPPVLITVIALTAIVATGAFFLIRALLPTKLDVQAVDVYMVVNGVRYTDIGERALGMNDVSYTIPGNRKIVVTRKNPNGEFLLLKININDKEHGSNMARMAGASYLTPGQIRIKGGAEIVDPLYASYADDTRGAGYQLGFNPGTPEKGPPPSLEEFLGPKREWSAWTHEGETYTEEEKMFFLGRGGMKVVVQASEDKIDKHRDGDPFASLGLRRDSNKGLGGLQLGGGKASKYVMVNWDNGSDGFMINDQAERPNDISLSWTVTAICKRPKSAAKEFTLMLFGKEQVVKLP
jgi:hypothetical protein